MLANSFTKKLHGRLFNMFREVIMGCKHISTLHQISFLLKERVGEFIDWKQRFEKDVRGSTNNRNGLVTIRLQRRRKINRKKEWSTFTGVSHYLSFIPTIYTG